MSPVSTPFALRHTVKVRDQPPPFVFSSPTSTSWHLEFPTPTSTTESSPAPSRSSSSQPSNNGTAIILGVLGGLFGTLLFVYLVWKCCYDPSGLCSLESRARWGKVSDHSDNASGGSETDTASIAESGSISEPVHNSEHTYTAEIREDEHSEVESAEGSFVSRPADTRVGSEKEGL